MARSRKNKDDAWMPPRVYIGRSAYEYHPKVGGNIRLCDKTCSQANREKAFMSRVYRWAYERGYTKGNPTKGVKQFKEIARDRYIINEEYNALFSASCNVVQIAMELAYLCCARQNDILEMKKSQLMEKGKRGS